VPWPAGVSPAAAGQVGAVSSGRLELALASPELSQALSISLFSSLVAAAHGSTNVPDYCGLLLGLPKLPDPGSLAQLPAPVLSGALAAPAGGDAVAGADQPARPRLWARF